MFSKCLEIPSNFWVNRRRKHFIYIPYKQYMFSLCDVIRISHIMTQIMNFLYFPLSYQQYYKECCQVYNSEWESHGGSPSGQSTKQSPKLNINTQNFKIFQLIFESMFCLPYSPYLCYQLLIFQISFVLCLTFQAYLKIVSRCEEFNTYCILLYANIINLKQLSLQGTYDLQAVKATKAMVNESGCIIPYIYSSCYTVERFNCVLFHKYLDLTFKLVVLL